MREGELKTAVNVGRHEGRREVCVLSVRASRTEGCRRQMSEDTRCHHLGGDGLQLFIISVGVENNMNRSVRLESTVQVAPQLQMLS